MKRFSMLGFGLFIIVLPIILALISSLFKGGSIFNEDTGSGAYLWLLIVSIPSGLLIVVMALIVKIIKRRRSSGS
jgi:hypothetical protein